MIRKEQFNIKYRPEIEAGVCKVFTRDGSPAKIIYWDANMDTPIVALVNGVAINYTINGTPIKGVPCDSNSLVLEMEQPLLEPDEQFVKEVSETMKQYCEYLEPPVKEIAMNLYLSACNSFVKHDMFSDWTRFNCDCLTKTEIEMVERLRNYTRLGDTEMKMIANICSGNVHMEPCSE